MFVPHKALHQNCPCKIGFWLINRQKNARLQQVKTRQRRDIHLSFDYKGITIFSNYKEFSKQKLRKSHLFFHFKTKHPLTRPSYIRYHIRASEFTTDNSRLICVQFKLCTNSYTLKFRYTMLNNIFKMHILKQKVGILE